MYPSDTTFSKLIYEGKLNLAIRYLFEDSLNGVLGVNDRPVKGSAKTVQDLLLEKHPDPKIPPSSVLMDGDPLYVNPIVFERLTPDLIKDVGRRSKGAAGPSGLDAEACKRMLTCSKQSSNRLCTALSMVAYCLCTEDLSNEDLSAFTGRAPEVTSSDIQTGFLILVCRAAQQFNCKRL